MDYASHLLCGLYKVTGTNPGSDAGSYEGQLEIAEYGGALVARWSIGAQGQVMVGRGLVSGHTLAIAFSYLHQLLGSCTGLVVYEIHRDGTLRGRWIGADGPGVGTETCELLSRPPALH